MTDGEDIDTLLNILGDEKARRILETLSQEPQSAKELSKNLDLSLPTVYRRLELLEGQQLVEDDTRLSDDGNHYKVYKCCFRSAVVTLDDGRFDAEISHNSISERLVDIWSEL